MGGKGLKQGDSLETVGSSPRDFCTSLLAGPNCKEIGSISSPESSQCGRALANLSAISMPRSVPDDSQSGANSLSLRGFKSSLGRLNEITPTQGAPHEGGHLSLPCSSR